MLLACVLQASQAFFVRSGADFDRAGQYGLIYFVADVQVGFFQQLRLENAAVDCLGHRVSADVFPFDIIQNVTFRSCDFALNNGLSRDFNGSALINCTVRSSTARNVFVRAKGSLFVGVRFSTIGSLITNLTDSAVVGCAFRHHCEATGKASPALLQSVRKTAFQNTYFDITIAALNQDKIGGIAVSCASTTFLVVKVRSTVTASLTTSANYAAGVIADAPSSIQFKQSDFVVNIKASYAYYYTAAIVASAATEGIAFYNISVAATIEIGMFHPNATERSISMVGSLYGRNSAQATEIRFVSAFVDMKVHNSQESQTFVVAGLVAYQMYTKLALYHCHVFGAVSVTDIWTQFAYVAGIGTFFSNGSSIDACSFNGNVSLTAKNASFAYVGGVGVKTQNISLRNSQTRCDLRFDIQLHKNIYVAGLLTELSAGDISAVVANVQIRAKTTHSTANFKIGGLLSEVYGEISLSCVVGVLDIVVLRASGDCINSAVSLMFAYFHGSAANCSANGTVAVSVDGAGAGTSGNHCHVAAIVGVAAAFINISNITAFGSVDAEPGAFSLSAAFGQLEKSAISSVVVAVAFPGLSGVNVFYDSNNATISSVFVDCGLTGNNISQEYCSSDLRSQSAADALGAGFGWKIEYNDGYPYLVNLPTWDGTKYVLPTSGPFLADFYYVDTLGYPFPINNYQICRGACYGVYESPLVRNCTNTTNNSYCIQLELAETDFQTASCIQENAHCNSGASICTSESELKLNQTDSTYICELGCFGCVNGHCQNNTCVCNLYHSEDDCSTYQCDSDSPVCFGDPTMQCAADGSRCVPTDACAALGCVHGSCVVNSSNNKTQCRCDNMWTGSRCDRCNAYGPECSVSQPECNRLCGAHGHCGTPLTTVCTCALGFGGANCGGCAASHTAVGDSCVCGDSGGPCQLRQTCVDGVCVADCLLTDPYCAECEVADQSVCARCVKQHTIQNGICQFHLSAAVSTSFVVVLGVAGAAAAALGGVLLFRLLSAKRGGSKQKPVGDGVKLDAVQSGPKSVGKAEKPLLEQIPAIQDVNIEIGIDSARDGR